MPNYIYEDCNGRRFEKNLPIDERDKQACEDCGMTLRRIIKFEGLVWSPTRNGGYS